MSTAAQITAVRAAADLGPGSVSLPVQGALVTFVKPLVPDAGTTTDPAGFIVQAGNLGPALFVSVDATSLPALAGDLVDFTVTAVTRIGQLRVASAITGFVKQSSGNAVSGLAQSASSVDFSQAALIDDRECELVSLSGTLVSDLGFAGGGYQAASLVTSGSLDAGAMKLRLPNALADSEGLGNGCSVQATAVPLWRYNAQAQPSAFSSSALAGSTCPAPTLVSAVPTSSTAVRATFSRPMTPGSVTSGTMTIAGLNVTGVSQLTASTWSLTTAAQAGGTPYTLTASTSVADIRGTPISASGRTATFNGFAGAFVINEVDYDQAGTDASSFIELYNGTSSPITLANYAVVLVNGGDNTEYARFALSGAGTTLAAGAYLVIANSTVTVPGGTLTIAATGDFIQNGPDAIALVNTSTASLVDALSYEGSITAATITGFTGMVSLVEGTAFSGADTNDNLYSLARLPNGVDTNNAASDWSLRLTITPGAANQ